MNSATTKQLSKTLSNQQLVMNAFSALPLELAMEILEYIPIKIYFEPRALTFYKDQLLLQNDFQMIPDALRRNSDFMNRLIRRNPKAKEYVIEPMVNEDCSMIQFTQEQYDYYRKFALNYRKFALKEVSKYRFYGSPAKLSLLCAELRGDKEIMLTAVQHGWEALEFASENLKNDKEIVLTALEDSYQALKFASDNLKNDKEFVLETVQKNGWALEFASDNLKNDKEIVFAAVQQNRGLALEFASNNLKNDKEIVLAAVNNIEEHESLEYASALEFASDNLKNDKEIVLTSVQKYGFSLEHASDDLKNDLEIVSAALNNNSYGYAEDYISENLKNDIHLICCRNPDCDNAYYKEYFREMERCERHGRYFDSDGNSYCDSDSDSDSDSDYDYEDYCTCKTEYVLKELQNLKDKRDSVATSPKLRKNLWEAVLDRLGACFKMTHPQESE
jgi:hypothetical protein